MLLSKNSGSKKCSKKLPYNKSFASHKIAKYFSKEENNNIDPKDISLNDTKSYKFKCKCSHIIENRISLIIKLNRLKCNYCNGKGICDKIYYNIDDCKFCYKKSFISHSKYQFWNFEKNTKDPVKLTHGTDKKCWFDCDVCNHSFEIGLNTIKRGSWCSYCSNTYRCENIFKCDTCFNKTFASHPKFEHIIFDEYLNFDLTTITLHSIEKLWFKCDNEKCLHKFKTRIADVTNGIWCPYCANQELCNNNCNICYNKSFATHYRSNLKYWSEKNKKQPHEIFKGSSDEYHFTCDKKHKFKMIIASITDPKKNHWCPHCVNKTEDILLSKLKPLYPNIKKEFKINGCKAIYDLRFDFCIKEFKIIIELDGKQHFEDVIHFKSKLSLEERQARDIFKMEFANKEGYSVIRLVQYDVLNKNYDYLNELIKCINIINNLKKVKNIFLCLNNEYEPYYDYFYN